METVLCTNALYFFFFQAEDGIRDLTVTGVQTCALPISAGRVQVDAIAPRMAPIDRRRHVRPRAPRLLLERLTRSEERRVGKECRSRGAPDHLKKKKDNQKQSQQKLVRSNRK